MIDNRMLKSSRKSKGIPNARRNNKRKVSWMVASTYDFC